jgi:hypothetical protein
MHSLTDGDVIDNSDVNHLEGGLRPRGEELHVAAERSIGPWNKMEAPPCGEEAVLCRERRLTAANPQTADAGNP